MYFGFNVVGAGTTPLHYAACGGNAVCFQVCPAGQKFVSSQIKRWQPKFVSSHCRDVEEAEAAACLGGIRQKQKLRHA